MARTTTKQSRLAEGDLAPELVLPDWQGETYDLSAHRGRPVWVAFFRYAACPYCNLRVHRMIEKLDAGELAGIDIVAVFQSPPEQMAEYVGKQQPPFPLLCDPAEASYATWGLEHSARAFASPKLIAEGLAARKLGYSSVDPDGTLTRIPADFLIDADGRIVQAYYGSNIGDHIGFDDVAAFAARYAVPTA